MGSSCNDVSEIEVHADENLCCEASGWFLATILMEELSLERYNMHCSCVAEYYDGAIKSEIIDDRFFSSDLDT